MGVKHMKNIATWLVGSLWLAACGSIAPEIEADGDGSTHVDDPSEMLIDATADETWIYFDFERGTVVRPSRPEQSREWDIAFRRFHVAVNGGVSGSGGVGVAVIQAAEFDDVTHAPKSGYLADSPDVATDKDEEPDYVMSSGELGWWDYDTKTHVLTPREHVYVVRTVEGGIYKLAFLDYYNEAGSSGHLLIKFAQLEAGEGGGDGAGDGGGDGDGNGNGGAGMPDAGEQPDAGPVDYETLTVDASAFESWVYVKIGEGTVSVADSSRSLDWDLAFKRFMIQTNSGSSGAGQAGARLLEGDFAAAHELPTQDGFVVDEVIAATEGTTEFSGNPALAGWYDYDVATHRVTPRDDVAFLVRSASGDRHAKLRITGWASGIYSLDLGTFGE
jgi:hypothetical protein